MAPRLNRSMIVVFQPKDSNPYSTKRRFAVGVYSLHKYVGEKNANVAIQRALKSELDKCTVLFRKQGRVDFYFK